MPGARCTRSLICKKVKAYERSHREVHRIHPAFPHAMVLTVYPVIFPVIGLCCHRHRRDTPHRLDASVETSEPHDFAVRPSAVRQQHVSVHRIPPRVRDDRDRPSMGRDGGAYGFDLGQSRTNLFLQMGMDRPNHVDPVQQNGFWEISLPSPASACPLTWQIDTLHLSRSNAGRPAAHASATTRR